MAEKSRKTITSTKQQALMEVCPGVVNEAQLQQEEVPRG